MTCLALLADADGRNGTNVLGRVHVSVDNKVSMPSVCLDGSCQCGLEFLLLGSSYTNTSRPIPMHLHSIYNIFEV